MLDNIKIEQSRASVQESSVEQGDLYEIYYIIYMYPMFDSGCVYDSVVQKFKYDCGQIFWSL